MNGQRLIPEIRGEITPSIDSVQQWDLDKVLSIDLIRQHTKTDDVPRVTDVLLGLYRKTAVEEAERYTGLLIAGQRQITERVKHPVNSRKAIWRGYFTHITDYQIADGMAYLYGQRNSGTTTLSVAHGTREVKIPLSVCGIDLTSSCCDPCATNADFGMMMMYRAGFGCVEDIPAGIILGCLKFIAWSISNPGDEIVTVKNRTGAGEAGIIGTNNGAWASGAIEQWRVYVKDAI